MLKLIVTILLMLEGHLLWSQSDSTGFYFVINCEKGAQRRITRFENKTVCITQKPVLTIKDFESVGELRQLPGKDVTYFDLTLTQNGYERLKQLLTKLPETQIALAVENKGVIFIIDTGKKQVFRSFRIADTHKTGDIYGIREKLKSLLTQ